MSCCGQTYDVVFYILQALIQLARPDYQLPRPRPTSVRAWATLVVLTKVPVNWVNVQTSSIPALSKVECMIQSLWVAEKLEVPEVGA